MSNYADWQFLPADLFATFEHDTSDASITGVDMLMLMNNDGTVTGDFRLCIFGAEPFAAHVRLINLLPNIPATEADTYIYFQSTTAEASPPINATANPWMDLEEMLKEKYALFTNKDGEAVDNDTVLRFLASTDEENAVRGAAVRWAIAANGAGKLQLQLQSLPTPARFLKSEHLTGDNSVSVLLGTYDLHADMASCAQVQGPVPLFFTEDRARAKAGVLSNFERTCGEVNRVNAHLLQMEHMPLFEAVQYLQGKKPRPAAGKSAFPAPDPPAKRARSSPDAPETGRTCST